MIATIAAAFCGLALGYLLAAKCFTLHAYRRALMDVMVMLNQQTTPGKESDDAFRLRLQVAGMIASFDAWRKKP